MAGLDERLVPPMANPNPHHEDPDFRAALACVRSGELGPLKAIERKSWVGELVIPKGARWIPPDEWLPRLLWEDLDQLLHLAGQPPESLCAFEFSTEPADYFVDFKFPNGLTGHLERRRAVGIPLELGWMIGSPFGGYTSGHRYIKTADGEIYDVPVELPPISNDPPATPLESLSPSMDGEAASRHVFQILRILEAIQQSARTGEFVSLQGRN
jgi:predicted dehydrogenase